MSEERGEQAGEPAVPPPPPRIPPPPGSTELPPSRPVPPEKPSEPPAPPKREAPAPRVVPGRWTANPVATASLAVGILAILTGFIPFTAPWGFAIGVLALVLGGIGIAKSRRAGIRGRGPAISGVVTGLIGLVAASVWIAIYFAMPDPTQGYTESIEEAAAQQEGSVPPGTPRSINNLAIGECFNSLQTAEVDQVFVVPCTQPHQSEVFAILDSPEGPGSPYPGSTAMHQAADGQCRADPYTEYVGGFDLLSSPQVAALYPSRDSWANGDRVIICTVSDPAAPNGLTTGSVRGTAEGLGLPTSPRPSPPPTFIPRPLPPTPTPLPPSPS